MFLKLFTIFTLVVAALAAPNPKPAPAPAPQFLAYTAPVDYVYPGVAPAAYVSPYAAAPLAYSALSTGAIYFR